MNYNIDKREKSECNISCAKMWYNVIMILKIIFVITANKFLELIFSLIN